MAVAIYSRMLMVFMLASGLVSPIGIPPAEEDATIAQIAPDKCLFFLSWQGTETPQANSKNSTEVFFANPKVLKMVGTFQELFMLEMSGTRPGNPRVKQMIEDYHKITACVGNQPGALFLTDFAFDRGPAPPEIKLGVVVRVGKDPDAFLAIVSNALQSMASNDKITQIKIEGQSFSHIDASRSLPEIDFGRVGEYFIVGVGKGMAEEIVKKMTTKHDLPAWYTEAITKLPVERMSTFGFINVDTFRDKFLTEMRTKGGAVSGAEANKAITAFGLDSIETVTMVTGLDETGFVNKTFVKTGKELTGLLTLLDVAPLTKDDLAGIHKDASVTFLMKLKLSNLLDVWRGFLFSNFETKQFESGLAEFEQTVGIDVESDLFGSMGERVRVFTNPSSNELISDWAFGIEIKDRKKLLEIEEKIVTMVEAQLSGPRPGGETPSLSKEDFSGSSGYTLGLSTVGAPFDLSWCLTDKEFLIAFNTETLQKLAAGEKGDSVAERPDLAGLFGEGQNTLGFVSIDMKKVCETVLPILAAEFDRMKSRPGAPELVQQLEIPTDQEIWGLIQNNLHTLVRTPDGFLFETHETLPFGNVIAMLPTSMMMGLPAIPNARGQAMQNQAMNNMKQIGLAMHNYASAFNVFPAGYSADKKGKPLLSWRVHILPYLEEQALYNEFHLDEPWDSEHNKKLIEKMPNLFRSPSSKLKEKGMTNYLGVSGADGVFIRPKAGDNKGSGFHQITDGTSMTIMTVEVPDKSAMIWTKPGDFAPNKKEPTKGLVGFYEDGFLAGFADGSVRKINHRLTVDAILGLFTKSGGEIVDEDELLMENELIDRAGRNLDLVPPE